MSSKPKLNERRNISDWRRRDCEEWFCIVSVKTSAMDMLREAISEHNSPWVHCCTWAVGAEQAKELAAMKERGTIKGFTIISDHSLLKRSPEAWAAIQEHAGKYAKSNTHAKIYLVNSAGKKTCILSSANMNDTPRTEFFRTTADPDTVQQCRDHIARTLKAHGRKG